ncbi:hypothetical protein AAW51_3462 [Caldimonas brevitalea]|uniref:Uncharacterized protein n=1 Tax=Caldimonas brevitalea TaxID=413882 RepID=A0A0G3BQ94_9BURK|nr:hypothetical protein AAW51_3462 [Caldimonas brevitalea]
MLEAGRRNNKKDDYDKRMEVFAQEMVEGDDEYKAELLDEVLKRDKNAFNSWLKADRLHNVTDEGRIKPTERNTVFQGMTAGIEGDHFNAEAIPVQFIHDSHDPALIASYIELQDTGERDGFERSLTAFAGVSDGRMYGFVTDPDNQSVIRDFTLAVQDHQDWYESQTLDRFQITTSLYGASVHEFEAPITFSEGQLRTMRMGFEHNNGLKTDGELLLAYPDRLERNEAVTQQYSQLSQNMGHLVGPDNANWATFAVWASDEIGRNLEGGLGIELGELGGGDPRYWLSVGNSKLISDIGPAFQHFNEVFADPANRTMSFDEFWSSFESEWGDRGISYLDGKQDRELDLRNAFKAYHEAMQLRQQEVDLASNGPGHEQDIEALADRRSELMLYANTLVGLQEQEIVQPEVEEGMQTLADLGPVNPKGAAAPWVDFHVPGDKPGSERRFDTDSDFPVSGDRVNLDGQFTTVGGETVELDEVLHDRLVSLRGDNKDPSDPDSAATDHWERYGDRMTYIYHLFAEYQRDDSLFTSPRVAFESRAKALNNDPELPPG